MIDKLTEKGIRLSLDAEQLIRESKDEKLLEELIALKKPMVTRSDVEGLLAEKKEELKIEVRNASDFVPLAKEHESNIEIIHTRDVTGKSRTKGEVENFVSYFRNRYSRISRLLRTPGGESLVDLKDIKRYLNERVRVNVMVSSKKETKKGNLLLEVEDLTGSFKVVVSNNSRNEKLGDKAKGIIVDEVLSITGKVLEPYIIAEDIDWPEIPVMRERKMAEKDLAIAYMSDTHFGSRYFLERECKSFVDWIHGRGEAKELAGKVKYLIIAGDLVDGIGIYPNQEKELVVKDIYAQYKMFDDFVESLPDWIEVPVVARLTRHFGVPACLENDADAAALGEYWAGAAKPTSESPAVRCLYAITVGTGIGTACIIDGQVYRGANGFHPEGGHQIVDPSGPQCYCGGKGCWESWSSGTAIGRAAREAIQATGVILEPGKPEGLLLRLAGGEVEGVDAAMVAEAARQGDLLACQVMARAAEAFATGVFNILMLFQPEMIVLSGGVMRSLDLFMPAIDRVIQAADVYIPARQVRILPAQLGYYAGIYGAAYAILKETQ